MEYQIHEQLMREALIEAQIAFDKGEVPIGAVIADKNAQILARAHNLVETLQDVTAHAEILALRDASRYIQNWRLESLSLYVTLEPCVMCSSALMLSRLDKIYYGCKDSRLGSLTTNINICDNPKLPHQIMMTGGVLAEECKNILQKFFKLLRQKSK